MKKLTVNVAGGYDILIEEGLLPSCGAHIKAVSGAKKVMIITDSNVAPLYLEQVKSALGEAGFAVFDHIFQAGESSKTIDSVYNMVLAMADAALTRKDLVVALGGGVCGDMAGFAASVYLRGIDYVQIPTTLLSQIDSSVGGKTGIDLPHGKNLCGAFHQPVLVLIDPMVLDTLPAHFFADGMAEAIKYGCIKSKTLFERLEKQDAKSFIEDLIYDCVDIKRGVVERDEKEQGERALLNFGHTIGHAIEKHYHFERYSHGEAVGIGMVMITRISERLGLTPSGTADRICGLLKKYALPVSDSIGSEDVLSAMSLDKKRTGSGINFIMLGAIGDSFIRPVATRDLRSLFE